MNEAASRTIGRPSRLSVVSTAVIALLVGIAMTAASHSLTETGGATEQLYAPGELCRFNTFEVSEIQTTMPAMVSKCDYLFQDGQYLVVGYRI